MTGPGDPTRLGMATDERAGHGIESLRVPWKACRLEAPSLLATHVGMSVRLHERPVLNFSRCIDFHLTNPPAPGFGPRHQTRGWKKIAWQATCPPIPQFLVPLRSLQ
uniref:Uncharacterized protein n=1 Tax=Eutreptiella gymnastica TaxID=73025 RepID=A0A7S1J1Q5_9EUGL